MNLNSPIIEIYHVLGSIDGDQRVGYINSDYHDHLHIGLYSIQMSISDQNFEYGVQMYSGIMILWDK